MDNISYTSTANTQFCMLIIGGKFLSSKVDVGLDFRTDEVLLAKHEAIIEKTSRVKEVSNLIDALNYMTNIGWEFVQAIVSDTAAGSSVGDKKYLLKRTY